MLTPRTAIQRMKPYHPPLEGRRNFLRLDFNENTQGCSPAVLAALKSIGPHDIAAYPEYEGFRQKLARYAGLSPDQVLPTNASDEGILTVFQTFLDPKSEIVLPVPTFAMFRFYAELQDLSVKEVLYHPNLAFPENEALAAIGGETKAVILVNPNNPTGTSIRRELIVQVLNKMRDRLVVVDEAYVEFHRETVFDLLDRHTNLVVLRTFSKAFGMAGMRLGYLASCAQNIAHMAKAHSPYSIGTLSMKLAEAAFGDESSVRAYAAEVVANRTVLYEKFLSMGLEAYPSSANFVLVKFGDKSKWLEEQLKERGILVRDRSSDPLLKGFLRFTVGTAEHTRRLVDALQIILGSAK